jgi:hypothetical protein
MEFNPVYGNSTGVSGFLRVSDVIFSAVPRLVADPLAVTLFVGDGDGFEYLAGGRGL